MRGFTLVELLAVLVVIGIIALITIPLVVTSINSSKKSLYDDQVMLLEHTAENWALNNTSLLSKTGDFSYCVTIEEMKKAGLLDNKEIVNPITDEIMNGCVIISYDVIYNQFNYEYKSE